MDSDKKAATQVGVVENERYQACSGSVASVLFLMGQNSKLVEENSSPYANLLFQTKHPVGWMLQLGNPIMLESNVLHVSRKHRLQSQATVQEFATDTTWRQNKSRICV